MLAEGAAAVRLLHPSVWRWGVTDALTAALWSGPTSAFIAAYAVVLGATGWQLGLLLAVYALLTNGLQLYGAQWTRRGRSAQRVASAAIAARGGWALVGGVPALLWAGGVSSMALAAFVALLSVVAVATAAASPAMGARAASAAPAPVRTRYLADRTAATFLGALLGTAGMTALLAMRPGPGGYAAGFAAAAAAGVAGLGAYAMLSRAASDEAVSGATGSQRSGEGRARAAPEGPPTVVPSTARVPAGPVAPRTWWTPVARRLGAPADPALGELVLGAAILQMGASMVGPASPLWLVKHLGAPPAYLGSVTLASSLTALGTQRLWARWSDRWGLETTISRAGALASLVPLGWLLVWYPWVALPLGAFGGFAWGGYGLAMTARLLHLAPEHERPAYLAAFAAAAGAAGAAGSLASGLIMAVLPIPAVFAVSLLVRGLGWWRLSR